jgi:dipeptidyl aminopeptidase/acylaminoacyl peptidase
MLISKLVSNILAISLLLMGSSKKIELAQIPLISRKVFFNNPDYKDPQISPDGNQLAYLAPNDQGSLNIWIKTIGKNDDKVLTNDLNEGIHKFFWQYDNQHILFLKDKDGDQNFHLFQINIQNKRTRDLTPYDNSQTRIIKYFPNHPNSLIIALNKRNKAAHDIFKLDLLDGELQLLEENPGNFIEYLPDNNLKVRAAIKANDDGSYNVLIKINEDSNWSCLFTNTVDDQNDHLLAFSDDNRNIYMLSSYLSDTLKLVQINLETNNQTIIYEHPNYDLKEVIFQPNKNIIEGVNYLGEFQRWAALENKFSKDLFFILNNLDGNIKIISRNLKNTIWIIASDSDNQNIKYYVYERSLKTITPLYDSNKILKNYKLAKTWPFSFKTRDNMTIYGYYTMPPISKQKLPTIMLIHGGPWKRDYWKFNPIIQWLANRGYAVVQVNYRGSCGYGKKYLSASRKEWGNKMHFDLIDAKNWAIKQGIADPNKIAIMGGSFGGYATLIGLSFTPDEFCCGVSYVGPSNLVTLLNSIPPYWKARVAFSKKFIGDLKTEKKFLKERSPISKVDKINKPLLIAQGANDPIVPKEESDQIVNAMRDHNLKVDYLLFPDEGHSFQKLKNKLKCYAATEAFLAKYLGGREEKVAPDEEWDEFIN